MRGATPVRVATAALVAWLGVTLGHADIPVPVSGLQSPVPARDGVALVYYGDEMIRVAVCESRSGRLRWRTGVRGGAPTRFEDSRYLATSESLCVPSSDGAFVFDLQGGHLRARLEGYTWGVGRHVTCSADRILLTGSSQPGVPYVAICYDARRLAPLWERALGDRLPIHAVPRDQAFELTFEYFVPDGDGRLLHCFVRIVLASGDGAVRSWSAVADPSDRVIPRGPPLAVRHRLTELLARKGGTFIRRTSLEHLGDLWFAGNLADRTAPATVYAIRATTGQVLWKRAVPGLVDILLRDRALVTAAVASQEARSAELAALAVDTGHPSWRVQVPLAFPVAADRNGALREQRHARRGTPATGPFPTAASRPASGHWGALAGIGAALIAAALVVAWCARRRVRRR